MINVRPVLTARGSGLDFGGDMQPDLVRGSGIRKSVPEPIWPFSGKVASQVSLKKWHDAYWLNCVVNKGRHVTLKYFSILIKVTRKHRLFILMVKIISQFCQIGKDCY